MPLSFIATDNLIGIRSGSNSHHESTVPTHIISQFYNTIIICVLNCNFMRRSQQCSRWGASESLTLGCLSQYTRWSTYTYIQGHGSDIISVEFNHQMFEMNIIQTTLQTYDNNYGGGSYPKLMYYVVGNQIQTERFQWMEKVEP